MSLSSKSQDNCPTRLPPSMNRQDYSNNLSILVNRKDFSTQTQPSASQEYHGAAPEAHRNGLLHRATPLIHQDLILSALQSELRTSELGVARREAISPQPTTAQDHRSDGFPIRIPGESRKDDFPIRIPGELRKDDIPIRIPGGLRREDSTSRIPPNEQRKESFPDSGSPDMSRDDFSSQLSSDIEDDDFSNQVPADLSSPKDIRGLLAGVAHGVFGTGTGKTLPEMIQSGRNAGLPLYVRCPICQKEFKQKSTLLQHGCIHIESRPYPCGECGKRFRQQSHLTQHLRIHTNEKPYGCLYCGRNFRQRTILNQHVRIHTGEKPYKCAQCGKDFRQKAILDQHTRTHQGDRPYCCPLPNCRRRFATEGEVKRHVENHVGPKRKAPPPPMNPSPLVKPELYLPQCYPHPGNFQQQYAMSQLLGQSPPQPTALVQ